MIGLIFNEKFLKRLSQKISDQLSHQFEKQNDNLEILTSKVDKLDKDLSELSLRLTHKELRDKTEYGQLVYKVNSLKDSLLEKKRRRPEKSSH